MGRPPAPVLCLTSPPLRQLERQLEVKAVEVVEGTSGVACRVHEQATPAPAASSSHPVMTPRRITPEKSITEAQTMDESRMAMATATSSDDDNDHHQQQEHQQHITPLQVLTSNKSSRPMEQNILSAPTPKRQRIESVSSSVSSSSPHRKTSPPPTTVRPSSLSHVDDDDVPSWKKKKNAEKQRDPQNQQQLVPN